MTKATVIEGDFSGAHHFEGDVVVTGNVKENAEIGTENGTVTILGNLESGATFSSPYGRNGQAHLVVKGDIGENVFISARAVTTRDIAPSRMPSAEPLNKETGTVIYCNSITADGIGDDVQILADDRVKFHDAGNRVRITAFTGSVEGGNVGADSIVKSGTLLWQNKTAQAGNITLSRIGRRTQVRAESDGQDAGGNITVIETGHNAEIHADGTVKALQIGNGVQISAKKDIDFAITGNDTNLTAPNGTIGREGSQIGAGSVLKAGQDIHFLRAFDNVMLEAGGEIHGETVGANALLKADGGAYITQTEKDTIIIAEKISSDPTAGKGFAAKENKRRQQPPKTGQER